MLSPGLPLAPWPDTESHVVVNVLMPSRDSCKALPLAARSHLPTISLDGPKRICVAEQEKL